MHQWGDEDFDWKGLDEAIYFIADWLSTWVRMPIRDYKEKYGTARIYCGFGWHGIYQIWRPRHCWYPRWWPMTFDFWLANTSVWRRLNKLVILLHQKAYAWRYKKAVQKWPHLYKEIVSMADYEELFEGAVPGYKHSDYWRKV